MSVANSSVPIEEQDVKTKIEELTGRAVSIRATAYTGKYHLTFYYISNGDNYELASVETRKIHSEYKEPVIIDDEGSWIDGEHIRHVMVAHQSIREELNQKN